MKKLFLKNGWMGKHPIIRIEFPYDFELKELVKTFPGMDWKKEFKVWYVPYSDTKLSELLEFFKGKVWLDYSQFKKVKIEEVFDDLPPISKELGQEIQKFADWMRNRRYSESTIKNYSGGLGLFLRFTGNKNPELISNEDLESFHKDYIILRKYSASFQSLVINAVKLYFLTDKKESWRFKG